MYLDAQKTLNSQSDHKQKEERARGIYGLKLDYWVIVKHSGIGTEANTKPNINGISRNMLTVFTKLSTTYIGEKGSPFNKQYQGN